MDRRHFVFSSAALAASTTLGRAEDQTRPLKQPLRVAVIGHTGRGDFGHGLDMVWLRVPETRLVAVADANEKGLDKARAKLKLDAKSAFPDYRKMLNTVAPDIVAICPRHADQHCEMILAAIAAGAKGIYIEKPFLRTPAEADLVMAACKKQNTKIAVAHRNRYHPALNTIDQIIAGGRIGRLLEVRGRGKGDRRGGAEDLWVLGSHVLNMVHYFLGAPKSCSAVMLQDGRRVTAPDVVEGAEGLGLLAGNELHARYEMEKGIAYFDSIANDGTRNAGFGLQLIGSEGMIAMRMDKSPFAHLSPGNPFQPTDKPRPWLPITTAGIDQPEPEKDLVDQVHRHLLPVGDLLSAIDENRSPLCDAIAGAITVEMICSVFESHRDQSRAIEFPLRERGNALSKL